MVCAIFHRQLVNFKVAEIQIRDKCEYKSREQNLEDYKGDSSLAWKIWIGLDLEGSGSLLEIKKKKNPY